MGIIASLQFLQLRMFNVTKTALVVKVSPFQIAPFHQSLYFAKQSCFQQASEYYYAYACYGTMHIHY